MHGVSSQFYQIWGLSWCENPKTRKLVQNKVKHNRPNNCKSEQKCPEFRHYTKVPEIQLLLSRFQMFLNKHVSKNQIFWKLNRFWYPFVGVWNLDIPNPKVSQNQKAQLSKNPTEFNGISPYKGYSRSDFRQPVIWISDNWSSGFQTTGYPDFRQCLKTNCPTTGGNLDVRNPH